MATDNLDPDKLDEKVLAEAKGLIEDRELRMAFDQLSIRVVDEITRFILQRPELLKINGVDDADRIAKVYACTMGWILGFQGSMQQHFERLAMAAFVSQYSADNAERVRLQDAPVSGRPN